MMVENQNKDISLTRARDGPKTETKFQMSRNIGIRKSILTFHPTISTGQNLWLEHGWLKSSNLIG